MKLLKTIGEWATFIVFAIGSLLQILWANLTKRD